LLSLSLSLVSVMCSQIQCFCDGPIHRLEETYQVCVCFCPSLSLMRCNNNPSHLQWGSRKRSEKEWNKECTINGNKREGGVRDQIWCPISGVSHNTRQYDHFHLTASSRYVVKNCRYRFKINTAGIVFQWHKFRNFRANLSAVLNVI